MFKCEKTKKKTKSINYRMQSENSTNKYEKSLLPRCKEFYVWNWKKNT